ncbi:hypothetical protein D9613_001017 [Agrocybe pediades]|uniref:Uncharacterized protein n=1 Tax=Agrocybe pediades TaxID=84607 RepID=A0A8H4R1L1_9AGAR|nr:hypothetical protein D9613_001017 [Agrocybe pediades]
MSSSTQRRHVPLLRKVASLSKLMSTAANQTPFPRELQEKAVALRKKTVSPEIDDADAEEEENASYAMNVRLTSATRVPLQSAHAVVVHLSNKTAPFDATGAPVFITPTRPQLCDLWM